MEILILIMLAVLVALGIGILIGYIWANKKNSPNQLPSGPLIVVSVDKKFAVLEEYTPRKKRFLVLKEAFAGQSVRENDIVQRIRQEKKEYRDIVIIDCPRLIKVLNED